MKKTTHLAAGLASDQHDAGPHQAAPAAIKLTAPASLAGALTGGPAPAVSSEILLSLGALYATSEMKGLLGELDEIREARGIQAGLVAALHAILPPAQFRAVMIQWEVDAIKLSEFLHLAGVGHQEDKPSNSSTLEIETGSAEISANAVGLLFPPSRKQTKRRLNKAAAITSVKEVVVQSTSLMSSTLTLFLALLISFAPVKHATRMNLRPEGCFNAMNLVPLNSFSAAALKSASEPEKFCSITASSDCISGFMRQA